MLEQCHHCPTVARWCHHCPHHLSSRFPKTSAMRSSLVVFLVAGIALLFFYRTSVVKHLVFYNSDTAEFGGVSLILDYATTDAERERGLGGRANVPYDYCMLFVFPREGKYGFWMKDMLVPVDIFWLDG